ncbi:MAG TPA: TonB-dependent receptor [Acidobacteriaceae bacterium]|nr:TonB-dependent receptor [Acidobacteriaceae bacterium]
MKKAFVCSLVILLSPLLMRAQVANNTSLVGTVADPSGSPISGGHVMAIEENTKVKSEVKTNGEGYYAISFILPGTYDITVEQAGFKKVTKTGVVVPTDQAVRTDFSMPVGSVDTSITVSANTPPMSTDDATLGETIAAGQVQDLPVQGHNALEEAALTSNVIIGSKTSYSGNPPGVDFIGAGQRETQNEQTLDGVTIMNNLGNVTATRPSADMVSEVQMQSGNYTAQYGAYLGVHINLVSKNGTNDLHGAAYDYVKNTAFDAHNFFDTPVQAKTPLNYNQYGFDVGGPVWIPKIYNGRNKTFFFGAYEKINQKVTTTGTTTVMTPAMEGNGMAHPGEGDFSALLSLATPIQLTDPYTGLPYPNNIIPASEINTGTAAIAQKYQAYVPGPNVAGVNNNLFNVPFANSLFIRQTLERVDENIGEHVKIFGRFHWQNLTYINGNAVPVGAGYGPAKSRNYVIGYTHVITPRLVNDLRVGLNTFLTDAVNYWYENGLNDAGTNLGIPGFNYDTTQGQPGVPNVQITSAGGMNIGNNGTNWFQDDRAIDAYDQVSYSRGKHNIMGGIEFRRLETGRIATNESLGEFTFNGTVTGYGAADFELGLPNSVQTPPDSIKGSVAEWRDGFFALDNWQVTPKLTINYGLRYDLPTVPFSLNGYTRIMNVEQTELLPTSSANSAATWTPVPGLKLGSATHDNWGPRLGFAYRPLEKTVVRGGGGFFYNANQLNSFTLLTSNNYPFGATFTFSDAQGTQANPLSFTNPTPGTATASAVTGTCTPKCTYGSAVTYDPRNKTQRSYQWNVSVGQELWKGAAIEGQYVGSHSLDLDISQYDNEPNELAPGAVFSQPTKVNVNSAQGSCGQANCLVRPNQLFGSIRNLRNIAYSHYNGLNIILRQRLSNGFSGQFSYTWSHDLDNASDSNGGGTATDPFNIAYDYGNSNWDIRHRFVGVLTYSLPTLKGVTTLVREAIGGWQLNDVLNLQTGEPFNVTLGYNSAGLSQGTERPSWVHKPFSTCNQKNELIAGSAASCINSDAYTLPVAQETLVPGSTTAIQSYNYAFGNVARNYLHGPGFSYDNFSIFKDFPIKERAKFQLRMEAQNVTNHPSAGNPNSALGAASLTGTGVSTSNFGTITSVQTIPGEVTGARVVSFAGKFIF